MPPDTDHRSVNVAWDAEASVYYTASGDIPGLNTEAETFDGLIARATAVIPELLSDQPPGSIQVSFRLERSQLVVVPA